MKEWLQVDSESDQEVAAARTRGAELCEDSALRAVGGARRIPFIDRARKAKSDNGPFFDDLIAQLILADDEAAVGSHCCHF